MAGSHGTGSQLQEGSLNASWCQPVSSAEYMRHTRKLGVGMKCEAHRGQPRPWHCTPDTCQSLPWESRWRVLPETVPCIDCVAGWVSPEASWLILQVKQGDRFQGNLRKTFLKESAIRGGTHAQEALRAHSKGCSSRGCSTTWHGLPEKVWSQPPPRHASLTINIFPNPETQEPIIPTQVFRLLNLGSRHGVEGDPVQKWKSKQLFWECSYLDTGRIKLVIPLSAATKNKSLSYMQFSPLFPLYLHHTQLPLHAIISEIIGD